MEVRLDKLIKVYDGVRVVDELDLEVGDGEMVALLGPSGCGKTTTLLAISGIQPLDAGRVYFGGRDVTALPPQERNAGVVFQSYALYPHLDVRENIAFPLRIRGLANAEIERRVREMASALHIEALLRRRPAQLSGGQQQRVAVARALVRDPAVLLMDEPLANLDARLRLEMRAELRRIQQASGSTAIMVTHDQAEAMSMCDRIALMHAGRLEQVGTPAEVYARPRNLFTAGFIGSPPIAFYPGRRQGPRFAGEAIGLELPERLRQAPLRDGEPLTLGVRPEALRPGGALPVEGTLAAIEPQGRETLYTVRLADGRDLRSVQSGASRWRVGERVRWGLDAGALLFFDGDGNRL